MKTIKVILIPFIIMISFMSLSLLHSCSRESIKTVLKDSIKTIAVYDKKQISFKTSDNLKIQGEYFFSKEKSNVKEPLVILIHQFKSDRRQWKQDFIDSLLRYGYKVITYDIRSHGESDKAKVELMNLLTDKEQTPKDIEAVFIWTKTEEGIDTARIAVVGTSIGASLALYSKYYLGAKTMVGISGGKSTFRSLTGIDERSMNASMVARKTLSVLFICGKNDGEYAKDEESILYNFIESPKEIKLYDSDKHGQDLIEQFPEINIKIIEWLKKLL